MACKSLCDLALSTSPIAIPTTLLSTQYPSLVGFVASYIMTDERNQTQKATYYRCNVYDISGEGRTREIENRSLVARG